MDQGSDYSEVRVQPVTVARVTHLHPQKSVCISTHNQPERMSIDRKGWGMSHVGGLGGGTLRRPDGKGGRGDDDASSSDLHHHIEGTHVGISEGCASQSIHK